MSSLVIVAVPAEDETVWKVSSEKVPHLTLMYLGEVEDEDTARAANRMAEFVEHALNINQHGPFYLDVDYRGELGDEKADVLFFRGGWESKWIKQLRGHLLQHNDIRAAYQSNDQFPNWVPHLTLGYPDAPAKPIPDEYTKIYGVQFDRIAVWTGDYEGPEFRLKWPERDYDDCSMAIHQQKPSLEEALEHYGVKGMRWGVRNDVSGQGLQNKQGLKAAILGQFSLLSPKFREHTSTETKVMVGLFGMYSLLSPKVAKDLQEASRKVNLDKADSQWEKSLKDGTAWVEVNNASADHFNKHIDSVNKKHENGQDWSNEDYSNPKDPAFKEYMKDVDKLTQDSIASAANQLYLKNPSGTKEVEISSPSGIPGDYQLNVKEVRHADTPSLDVKVTFKTDAKGRVTGFSIPGVDENLLQQTALSGEEYILEHFGVKGMHWGQRKEQVKSGAKAVGRGLNKVGTALADADFELAVKEDDQGYSRARDSIETMAAQAFHRTDLPAIKAKPEYQEAKKLRNRLRHPRDPMTKQYRKEVKEAYIQRLEDAANKHTNVSGTRQYTIRERGWELPEQGGALPQSRGLWEVSSRPIKHADTLPAEADHSFTVEVIMDDDGFVTELKKMSTEKSIAQSADGVVHCMELGAEFLEHYGVKGMRWGQRKERFQSKLHERRVTAEEAQRAKRPARDVRTYDSIGSSKRKKSKIDTKGGEDHPPTEDAIKVAESKQKLKKSGVNSLSNKELQEVATRLQLEENVARLTGSKKSFSGKKFVDQHLTDNPKNQKKLLGFGVKTFMKKAGKKAAVAAI